MRKTSFGLVHLAMSRVKSTSYKRLHFLFYGKPRTQQLRNLQSACVDAQADMSRVTYDMCRTTSFLIKQIKKGYQIGILVKLYSYRGYVKE